MPSRLRDAASSYLRSAAHQPVEWFPWGTEAFARARAEQKPIVLDIGAVWCHWCHVMDGESYEDPAIAEILNRDWICVKVDRDERPDVDARYQRAVQLVSGQGGWPLTAFLTPDGEVFYGGTYFPPDGTHGRPGFATVLRKLAALWSDRREEVTQQVSTIRAHLDQAGERTPGGPPAEDALTKTADGLARVFDFRYGGFGTEPKFPHPTACEFLLDYATDSGLAWPREMAHRTLLAMARGGVYDQVGGGFHRYAVDARWIVPHFEKMSYDNSELLRAYVRAAAATLGAGVSRPTDAGAGAEFHRVIDGILDWVTRTMSDPAGGYYASQDADVGLEDDGDSFTWTVDEARAALEPDELRVLERHYDIGVRGEMRHDPTRNVLWIRETPAEIARALGDDVERVRCLIGSGRERLRRARAQRPAPAVDRACYVGWNAMMASAVLQAGALLDRPDLDRHALLTLERLFREACDGPRVGRRLGADAPGVLDDHVHLARAALDAYEATGVPAWRARAAAIMEHVWQTFRAPGVGLLDRPADRGGEGWLDRPIRPLEDAPSPSPVGVAAAVLARLGEHTGTPPWHDRLAELTDAVGAAADALGVHGASLALGVAWRLHPAAHVVVVAEDDAPGRALARAARVVPLPRKVLTVVRPGAAPAALPPSIRAMLDGAAPRAYVCAGTRCAPPLSSPDALMEIALRP